MFTEELNFFIKNQDDLVKRYSGKALVIKGQELYGVYETALDAYVQLQLHNELGKAMIQMCQPGPAAYSATLNYI